MATLEPGEELICSGPASPPHTENSFIMNAALLVFGLVLICCGFTGATVDQLEVSAGFVRSECRDRYLWIHVASAQTPRFEAVDGDEVHSIKEPLASRCGYTISNFRKDHLTSFRASYYSCFTHNQNDEVFTFKFNVMVGDGGGRWTTRSVSAVCSGPTWTHREVTCEEDYMEVNVNRESSCGSRKRQSRQVWQEALSQVQRKASWAWQLMFLQSDGQASSMSVTEAQRWGYSLTASTNRVVLRSPYKQPHAQVTMVDGVRVEAIQVSLFFKQKLQVVMIDISMACPLNSGSFDGTRLFWDIPQVLPPLVGEGTGFESKNFSLGMEGVLLDKSTVVSRGLSLIQQGGLVKIGVPFGAEGGYRKGLVVENSYKEVYSVHLLYEHDFSLVYEDGSTIDTKHRMLKVLETPPICHPPFTINMTTSDRQMFNVYLGNIPADVILEDVKINGKLMMISGKTQPGLSITPLVYVNGSQAYELQLPFDNAIVHWTNMGGGVVQYFIDMNFTLNLVPQRELYYHRALITAQVFNAFPPEITAQCLERGISFSVVRPSQSLWEVGIDQEPLTTQLVDQRGYHLHNDSQRTVLEVPIFSVGYTYEEINLSNFYATFKLLLRDSKTLEVLASTSKRCLFRTQDMIVCSADGTMTVVATPTSTWPSVQPERTSLLDRTCRPKQMDGTRVLFEFKLGTCGTRAMVGEWYMVYENEILHDRQLIADGPNFISREPQFKVTVRCFYPLSEVSRISVERVFESPTPGLGSFKVFESHTESEKNPCPHQDSESAISVLGPGGTLPQATFSAQPNLRPSHFPVPSDRNKLLATPVLPNLSGSPETHTHQVLQANRLPDGRIQWVDGPNQNSVVQSKVIPGQSERDSVWKPFDGVPDVPVNGLLGSLRKKLESMNSLTEGHWPSTLTWAQPSPGQTAGQDPDLKRLPSHGMSDLNQSHETKPALSLHGSSGGGMEMANVVRPVYQPPAEYKPPQTARVLPFLQPQDHIRNELLLPSKYQRHVPADSKDATFKTPIPTWSELLQESLSNKDFQNKEGPGPVERRNVRHKVQNIRVRPPSKFAASGLALNQKPVVQPVYSQSSDLLQLTNYGAQWTSKETPEHQGSNTRQDHVVEKPSVVMTQERGLHGAQVKQNYPVSINLTKPDWAGHQHKLVQSLKETDGGRPEFGSFQMDGLKLPGPSRVRVRPARLSRLLGQGQSKLLQNPDVLTKEGANGPPYHSFVSQTNASLSNVNVQRPVVRGAGLAHVYTDPKADQMTQGRLGCDGGAGQQGTSVHQGIIRGKLVS